MVAFYPLIIETAVEFKIEYKKLDASKNSKHIMKFNKYLEKQLIILPEDEKVMIVQGYRFEKYNGKIYCVREGQTGKC